MLAETQPLTAAEQLKADVAADQQLSGATKAAAGKALDGVMKALKKPDYGKATKDAATAANLLASSGLLGVRADSACRQPRVPVHARPCNRAGSPRRGAPNGVPKSRRGVAPTGAATTNPPGRLPGGPAGFAGVRREHVRSTDPACSRDT